MRRWHFGRRLIPKLATLEADDFVKMTTRGRRKVSSEAAKPTKVKKFDL